MKNQQEKIKKFCEERNWRQFHNPKDLLLGVVEEVGELRNIIKWEQDQKVIYEAMENNKAEVADNIGDILWFIAILANNLDIDLDECLNEVIESNKKRFPLEKTKNRHTNIYLGGHDGHQK